MKGWVKVWWHCLLKTFANMRGEYHRMCSLQTIHGHGLKGKGPKHHYCECGYNESEFVKSWKPIIRKYQ